MANKEQIEILKKGASAWNKWRKKHPGEEIDLKWEVDLFKLEKQLEEDENTLKKLEQRLLELEQQEKKDT
jgi:CII-binding regulator of phage lambda lysogenization HflD